MRHANTNRKFGKTATHRRAMFRNMATSLLQYERFYTTVEKAKDLRKIVEPLITMAKKDTLHARKMAHSYLMDKEIVKKLFLDISPRFKGRDGGYLRVVRADRRHGDAAEMAFVELIEKAKPQVKTEGEKKEAKSKEKAPKKEKVAKAPKEAKEKKAAKAK
jgi:large subunit ribosomal protein L17